MFVLTQKLKKKNKKKNWIFGVNREKLSDMVENLRMTQYLKNLYIQVLFNEGSTSCVVFSHYLFCHLNRHGFVKVNFFVALDMFKKIMGV